jgi:hypothetical protein
VPGIKINYNFIKWMQEESQARTIPCHNPGEIITLEIKEIKPGIYHLVIKERSSINSLKVVVK